MVDSESHSPDSLTSLTEKIRQFAAEREWEKFHTPRNLLLALVGEVGELAELFQWVHDGDVGAMMAQEGTTRAVRDELADVATYCLRLADVLGIDLAAAIRDKMAKNAAKYPVDKAKGNARKYTDFIPKS